ncbi:hypothetical protein BDW60DRAFT_137864 [Aspergillus nidulans var. acristatus]
MREELSRQLRNTETVEEDGAERAGLSYLYRVGVAQHVPLRDKSGWRCEAILRLLLAAQSFPRCFAPYGISSHAFPKSPSTPDFPAPTRPESGGRLETEPGVLWRENTGRSDDQQPQSSILSPFPLVCPVTEAPGIREANSPPLTVKKQSEPGFCGCGDDVNAPRLVSRCES